MEKNMKVAIVGSRKFRHLGFASNIIYKVLVNNIPESPGENELYLVSGGAKGIDSLAEQIADKLRIEKIIFKPDWDKYGISAGYVRNNLIIKNADIVIAFWDGKSKGTKNSIDLAIKANKPVDIYIRS